MSVTFNKLTSDEICSICFDNADNSDKTGHLTHIFHTHCILPWLEIDSSCPTCRSQVSSLNDTPILPRRQPMPQVVQQEGPVHQADNRELAQLRNEEEHIVEWVEESLNDGNLDQHILALQTLDEVRQRINNLI